MVAGTFKEIVQARLDEKGITKYQAALDANLPQDSVRYVLDGRMPRLDRAEDICKALGLEFYIGPPRANCATDHFDSQPTPDLAELIRGFQLLASNLVRLVPMCGPVGEPDEYGMHRLGDGWFMFDWMVRRGVDPSRCRVGEVRGDDMEPTLREGGAVLVDTDCRKRKDVGIFMLATRGRTVLRRLRRQDRRWLCYGDNPVCPEEPLAKDAKIVGQVVWSSAEHCDDAGPFAPRLDMRVLRLQMAQVVARLEVDDATRENLTQCALRMPLDNLIEFATIMSRVVLDAVPPRQEDHTMAAWAIRPPAG